MRAWFRLNSGEQAVRYDYSGEVGHLACTVLLLRSPAAQGYHTSVRFGGIVDGKRVTEGCELPGGVAEITIKIE